MTERMVLGGGDDIVIDPSTDGFRLMPRHIKEFSKPIQQLLREIVNEHKVRIRVIDSGHVLLYPPDGTSRPFKVSSDRPVQVNRQILEVQFMQAFGLKHGVKNPAPVLEVVPDESPEEEPMALEAVPQYQEAAEPPASYVSADVVRQVINQLSAALGIDSVEDEALAALEEIDRLKAQVLSLEQQVLDLDQLNTTLVKRAEKAEAKWDTMRELFRD